MWPKDSSLSPPKSQIVSRLPQNNVHTLMQCSLSFHFPAACPILVFSSTTIWMSESLQVPILQAARAALPQGLILCTDIICPAFTDRWKCDFISNLQVRAPLGSHSLPFAPVQYAQESREADDNVICRASYILRDTCR